MLVHNQKSQNPQLTHMLWINVDFTPSFKRKKKLLEDSPFRRKIQRMKLLLTKNYCRQLWEKFLSSTSRKKKNRDSFQFLGAFFSISNESIHHVYSDSFHLPIHSPRDFFSSFQIYLFFFFKDTHTAYIHWFLLTRSIRSHRGRK